MKEVIVREESREKAGLKFVFNEKKNRIDIIRFKTFEGRVYHVSVYVEIDAFKDFVEGAKKVMEML